jgi:hypothetical protein
VRHRRRISLRWESGIADTVWKTIPFEFPERVVRIEHRLSGTLPSPILDSLLVRAFEARQYKLESSYRDTFTLNWTFVGRSKTESLYLKGDGYGFDKVVVVAQQAGALWSLSFVARPYMAPHGGSEREAFHRAADRTALERATETGMRVLRRAAQVPRRRRR